MIKLAIEKGEQSDGVEYNAELRSLLLRPDWMQVNLVMRWPVVP
jgi:hypothetical protein